MRPLALELEGFAAFRERTTVDFRDADLFAIVGATGHGKSSLIDAISFALYGKVPRHGERDIAPVMTLGCNETRVSFTFELAGASYIATRILRRKASGDGATTRALRLEQVRPDGGTDVLAGSAREFQPAIQKLVGLDFEQFTKCVVLPQGQFASFLHARAGDRVAILSALLDLGRYDRMATVARERAKRAAGAREVLVTERTRLGEATPEAVDRGGPRSTRSRSCAPTSTRPVRTMPRSRPRSRRRGPKPSTNRRAAQALTAVRVPDELRAVVEQIDDARAAVERAAVAADAAEGRAITAAGRVRRTTPRRRVACGCGRACRAGRGGCARRQGRRDPHGTHRCSPHRGRCPRRGTRERVEQAQAELERVQHRHAHAALRASLHVGEPCPICDHDVAELPPKLPAAELDRARKHATAAKKELEAVERTAREAHTALTQADTLLEGLRERITEYDARVAAYPDAAALTTLIDAVEAHHARAAEARAVAAAARREATETTKRLAGFDSALARAEATLQEQRDALVKAGLEPPRRGPRRARRAVGCAGRLGRRPAPRAREGRGRARRPRPGEGRGARGRIRQPAPARPRSRRRPTLRPRARRP